MMRPIILILMLLAAALSPGRASASDKADGSLHAWTARADAHRTTASTHTANACDPSCPAVLPGLVASGIAAGRPGSRRGLRRELLAWSYEPPVPSGVPRDW